MNVLVLYDAYSTHTNTVYEHVAAFASYSQHRHVFLHCGAAGPTDWSTFDAVVVHYSARLITDAVHPALLAALERFPGGKVLFVQDEYDLTERLRKKIELLKFGLVFTCVPAGSVETIYPAARFPGTRFISTLTGFASLPGGGRPSWRPVAERPIVVGYRGRALPFWYGDLGQEKQEIAQRFRAEAEARSVPVNIEWDDEHRIYGAAWNAFLASCRATLGTESGSNLFDDDGKLRAGFEQYRRQHPAAPYREARLAVVGDAPEARIMNQVSPRIFESIEAGTALILFEGTYSGVVQPGRHYIELKKDFSNVGEVFDKLADSEAITAMLARAWDDVIGSGKWSYPAFVKEYDLAIGALVPVAGARAVRLDGQLTDLPHRYERVRLPRAVAPLWRMIPPRIRTRIYPAVHAAAKALRF